MYDPIKTIHLSPSVKVSIYQDPVPESPANWDNLGSITYSARSRHTLGTEPTTQGEHEEIKSKIASGELVGLPVYAYIHGGAIIRTTPFSCPWDSGQSGWVYCTKADARKTFGGKILTAKARQRTLNVLQAEVETFNQYLNGEVYGYVVIVDGEEVDSCWGYYGLKDVEAEGVSAAKYAVETTP